MIKHYSVTVYRTIGTVVEVLAQDKECAADKALEMVGMAKDYNTDWEDTSIDDEVIDVREVGE